MGKIETAIGVFMIYLIISLVFLFIRFLPMDCKHRYIDFLFPLSKLHCEVINDK